MATNKEIDTYAERVIGSLRINATGDAILTGILYRKSATEGWFPSPNITTPRLPVALATGITDVLLDIPVDARYLDLLGEALENIESVQANMFGPVKGVSETLTLTGMTEGSLLYVGPDGLISQNNAKWFVDNTNSLLGLGAHPLASSYVNPNTTTQPQDATRTVEINTGLNITPKAVSGIADINILFDRGDGTGGKGIGYINWAEKINVGPNAGKFIKRYSIGNDVFQPLVTSAVGDSINPLFVLFNFTDPDLTGTSYDHIVVQTYFENLGGGGNDRYAGQMSFGSVINAGSIYTFASFPGIPSTYYLMDLHFDDSTFTRPYLRLTYSSSGYTRFDISNNGSMRWWGQGATHNPSAGQGDSFTFLGGGANDKKDLEIRGGNLRVY